MYETFFLFSIVASFSDWVIRSVRNYTLLCADSDTISRLLTGTTSMTPSGHLSNHSSNIFCIFYSTSNIFTENRTSSDFRAHIYRLVLFTPAVLLLSVFGSAPQNWFYTLSSRCLIKSVKPKFLQKLPEIPKNTAKNDWFMSVLKVLH